MTAMWNADMSAAPRDGFDLTPKQRDAIVRFDPGVYHGTGTPRGVSGSVKGRLCHIGMLERVWTDKVGGDATFILTEAGEKKRARILALPPAPETVEVGS